MLLRGIFKNKEPRHKSLEESFEAKADEILKKLRLGSSHNT